MSTENVQISPGYLAMPSGTREGYWIVKGPDGRILQGEAGGSYQYKDLQEAKDDVDVLLKINACRVIFLDFDGVIMTLRLALATGQGWVDPPPDPLATMFLRRICEIGVKIVVTSTWRKHELGGWGCAKNKLKEGNLLEFLHEDWRTIQVPWGTDGSRDTRPREITEWLSRHPEVTDYRIIDDDSFAWTPEQDAKWIRCHPGDGLPSEGMIELLDWLKIEPRKKNG